MGKMASLMRIARQGCRVLTRHSQLESKFYQPRCLVSTSKKDKAVSTIGDVYEKSADVIGEGKKVEHFKENDDNWMSYGYSLTDREYDVVGHNLILFLGITVCICWGSFIVAYHPDHRMRDWACREGYLELARREREGLPLIDGNSLTLRKLNFHLMRS